MTNIKNIVDKIPIAEAIANATGSMDYQRIVNSNDQEITGSIRTGYDVALLYYICHGHYTRAGYTSNDAPAGFSRFVNLFDDMSAIRYKAVKTIYDTFMRRWFKPVKRNVARRVEVKNPVTNRYVKRTKGTFKRVFKNIKIRSVKVSPDHVFNTKDYPINDYCCPSFCKANLPKKKYAKIEEELNIIKTPNYEELTNLLNSVEYGLDIYLLDGYQFQEQTEFKNKFKVLIHDSHLYHLVGKSIYKTIKNIEKINSDDFNEKLKTETSYSTSKSIILDGVKYQADYENVKISKIYQPFINTYSYVNVDFYNECGIRPLRYYEDGGDECRAIDINEAYKNIICNESYIFGLQDGHEQTRKYSGKTLRYGFYYVSFNKMTDIDKAVFNKKCWIYGDLILNLNLDVKILYEHIPNKSVNGGWSKYKNKYEQKLYEKGNDINIEQPDKHEYSRLSGLLAQRKSYDYEYFNTNCEYEEEVLFMRHSVNASYTENGTQITTERLKKNTGLYIYLSILSYAKLQMYKIYEALQTIYKTVTIKRIFTDSIAIEEYDDEEENKDIIKQLNKILKPHKISVKDEGFKSELNVYDTEINASIHDIKLSKYDKTDVYKLIDANQSMLFNGRGGLGKTYTIKEVMKYLKSKNKKYVLTSTTKANAEQLHKETGEGVAIQSLLLKKDVSLKDIYEYFKDIDYLIIDEISQVTGDVLNMIHFIKSRTNCKILLSGDRYQCAGVDCDDENWLNSYALLNLVDFNEITFKWHKYCRYTKEYSDILDGLIKLIDIQTKTDKQEKKKREKIHNYLRDNYKNQLCKDDPKDDPNPIKICWTHNYAKSLGLKEAKDIIDNTTYQTVHKVQGESINTFFSIYQLARMPYDVMYTALSRASSKEIIRIY